jgi:hypothetical protein
MRLSEKTLELSFCAQFAERWNLRNVIWFGLTQAQERRLGFDACSRINGRLLVFQFKASNVIVHHRRFVGPRRRFTIPHDQLLRLRDLATGLPRAVYYAFPDLGTTYELSRNQDLIQQTWLLDVAGLPPAAQIPMPRNRARRHYAFTDPPACELRSELLQVKLLEGHDVMENLKAIEPNSKSFVKWCKETKFAFEGLRAYGLLWPEIDSTEPIVPPDRP